MPNIETNQRYGPLDGSLEIVITKKKGHLNTEEIRKELKKWLWKSSYGDDSKQFFFVQVFVSGDEDVGFNDDDEEGDFIIARFLGGDEVCPVCRQQLPENTRAVFGW